MNTQKPRRSSKRKPLDPPGPSLRQLHGSTRMERNDSKQIVEALILEKLKASTNGSFSRSDKVAHHSKKHNEKFHHHEKHRRAEKSRAVVTAGAAQLARTPDPTLETIAIHEDAIGYGVMSSDQATSTPESMFAWGRSRRKKKKHFLVPRGRGMLLQQASNNITTIDEDHEERASTTEESLSSEQLANHNPGAFAVQGRRVERRSRWWSFGRTSARHHEEELSFHDNNSAELSQLSMQVIPPTPLVAEVAVPNESWEARFEELQARVNNIHHSGTIATTIPIVAAEAAGGHHDPDVFLDETPLNDDWPNKSFLKHSYKKVKKSRDCRFILLALMLLLAGAITVPVLWSSKDKNSSADGEGTQADGILFPTTSPSPTMTPSPTPMTPVPTELASAFPTSGPTLTNPWQQIGQDLVGLEVRDFAGSTVALNYNATVLAVAAPQFATRNSLPGYVLVYQWDTASASWIQMGQIIIGDAADDEFGTSISLNGDGTILAIGAPQNDAGGTGAGMVRVYEFVNGNWTEQGSGIVGNAEFDNFGVSVSLSREGDVLAVGAFGSDINGAESGAVQVFLYNEIINAWDEPLGQTVFGQGDGHSFGWSVSLSGSGSVFAAGAVAKNAGPTFPGQVAAYQYNSTIFTWTPLGEAILGDCMGDWFGWSVALDETGSVLAASSRKSPKGNATGSVAVYDLDNNGTAWIQRGRTLFGEARGDEFGSTVALNRLGGNVLAIGSRYHDGRNGEDAGNVQVFEYASDDWIQVGSDIEGADAGLQSGRALSLSANGSVLASGDRRHDGRTGYARVFSFTN